VLRSAQHGGWGLSFYSITILRKFAYFGMLFTILLPLQTRAATKAKTTSTTKVKAVAAKSTVVNPDTEKLVLPTPEQLATELSIPIKEFPVMVDTFADALISGNKSKSYKVLCTKDVSACAALGDFFAQQDLQRLSRTYQAREKKVKPFKLTNLQAQEAQKMPYLTLVQRVVLNKEEELVGLANEAFLTKTCPRNLSAALAIRVEEYFPGTTARTLAKQLFEHARECINKDDQAFERLYLRQGLYALYDGNRERAEQLLLQAKEATQASERYRILYWLGKIAQSKGVKHEKNTAWLDLIAQFPLSFYSIQASATMGRDPLQAVTNHKVGGINRDSKENPAIDRSIRWLEALYTYKKFGAVAKWASWIIRDSEVIEVDVLQYVATIKIASGLYRSNIAMLFNYFRSHPSELNTEGLRLLYPRPYYDMVAEASRNKIDSFLVFGLMRQESAFDSGAISRAQAKGLMQIIPQTARTLASNGHKRLLNERDNTTMGVKYLVNLAERFGGKMELVLAAYNAGPMKVDEWLKRNPDRSDPLLWNDLIPYMETRDYVVSILRNNYFYIRLYGNAEDMNRTLASANRIYSSELVSQLILTKY
jgi:soluble lytic murein transglycosylase-like protein